MGRKVAPREPERGPHRQEAAPLVRDRASEHLVGAREPAHLDRPQREVEGEQDERREPERDPPEQLRDEIQRQVGLAYAGDELLLRESALVAMGRSMLPRWLPTIGQALADASPALRYEAARAVGEMGEDAQQLLPKLTPLLNDGDSEVAFAAIWALGQVGGSSAERLLKQIAKSEDEARRQAARDALDELSLGESLL